MVRRMVRHLTLCCYAQRVGDGKTAGKGSNVVVDWTGVTIGYYGQTPPLLEVHNTLSHEVAPSLSVTICSSPCTAANGTPMLIAIYALQVALSKPRTRLVFVIATAFAPVVQLFSRYQCTLHNLRCRRYCRYLGGDVHSVTVYTCKP
jgi:hypothetical protein